MLNRSRDEAGIVAAHLVIVLAFALFAVIQLTRTTIAAQQIDERVVTIIGEVGPIDEDLTQVPKLDETGRLAAEILASAEPLSGQADEIMAAAQSIDATVTDIQASAESINATVKSIRANFTALLPVVRSINDNVAAINGRVDRIIALVAGIRADLAAVSGEVGLAGPDGHGGKSIHGHANSIDCRVGGGACGD